jgi:hypothetical protein
MYTYLNALMAFLFFTNKQYEGNLFEQWMTCLLSRLTSTILKIESNYSNAARRMTIPNIRMI